MSSLTVRSSRLDDGPALELLDRATWTTQMSPAPVPGPEWRFFDERTSPDDVLVASDGDAILGYIRLGRATPLEASDHIVHINGLAVSPAARRRGVGRSLIEAAVAESRRRGARRVTLRVLGHNEAARALYDSTGFVVEGVLRGEFFLDGTYIDDVLMARELSAAVS